MEWLEVFRNPSASNSAHLLVFRSLPWLHIGSPISCHILALESSCLDSLQPLTAESQPGSLESYRLDLDMSISGRTL